MGKAKRKSFRYLPDSPIGVQIQMELIKITKQALVDMFSLNEIEFKRKRMADTNFAFEALLCLKFINQMYDPSIPTKFCLLCDYEYKRDIPPEMLIIMRPRTNQRYTCTMNILCPRCAAQDNDDVLDTKILAAYKKQLRTVDGKDNFDVSWAPECDDK